MNKTKKILYIAPEIPALSATFVYNEINSLLDKGFDIEMLSIHRPDVIAEEFAGTDNVIYIYPIGVIKKLFYALSFFILYPLRTVSIFFSMLRDIFYLKGNVTLKLGLIYRFYIALVCSQIIRKKNIDHIHIHFAHVPCDIGMYVSMLNKIPYTITSHANDIFQRGYLIKQKIQRSKVFVTISNFNKKYIEENFNLSITEKEKVKVIHCGVNAEKFTHNDLSTNHTFKFGVLCRLVEKKGIEYLISAASLLKDQVADFVIEIVGNGPLLDSLKLKTKRLKLTQQIHFLGKMPHEKVPLWLSEIDCFVLPCIKDENGDMDGIPVSLMEAMASGKLVLSTKISGIPELIRHNYNGFLVEPENPTALSIQMKEIVNLEEKMIQKITRNSVETIYEKFNASKNIKELSGQFECLEMKQFHANQLIFDDLTIVQAAERIKTLSIQNEFNYIVTPNIDHMGRILKNNESDILLSVYKNAGLCLCDSKILSLLLKWKYQVNINVVPGSTLTKLLFDEYLEPTDSILIIGGNNNVIEKLRVIYPALMFDHINPSMGFIENDSEVESLIKYTKSKSYNYIFLAVGSPQQETFTYKLYEHGINNGIALCIGASILFLTGKEKRAPKLFQAFYLEWFYRFLQNPKKLGKRYFNNFLQLKNIYMNL